MDFRLLLAVFGDIREIPFHAVHCLLADRGGGDVVAGTTAFAPPLVGDPSFLAVPAFVVNGTLESDLLPFWRFGWQVSRYS